MGSADYLTQLASAIAWPVAILALALLFRRPLAQLLPRLRSVRIGESVIEIHALDQQLVRTLDPDLLRSGTPQDPQELDDALALLRPLLASINSDDVKQHLQSLVQEFTMTRARGLGLAQRTRLLDLVAVKMRFFLHATPLDPTQHMNGRTEGERLLAVLALQLLPRIEHASWLADRIRGGDRRFIGFHAALALRALAHVVDSESAEASSLLVDECLEHLERNGETASNRARVLLDAQRILSSSRPLVTA